MGITDDRISLVSRLLLPTTVYQLRQRSLHEQMQSQLRLEAAGRYRYYVGKNKPPCQSTTTNTPRTAPKSLSSHLTGAISVKNPCAICALELMYHRTADMDVNSRWPEYVMRECGHSFHAACLFAFLSEKAKTVECETCAGVQAFVLGVFEGNNRALGVALDRVLAPEDTWALENKLADWEIGSQRSDGDVAVSDGESVIEEKGRKEMGSEGEWCCLDEKDKEVDGKRGTSDRK
jgi:hypothetical protein